MFARSLHHILACFAALIAGTNAFAGDTRDFRGNFSGYPGFAEYFAANPPSSALPTAADQALLEKYRPRFMLPRGHAGMIDFYGDYIASGRLYDGAGNLISDKVTREVLNAHKNEPDAVFVHEPDGAKSPLPAVYGRVERDTVDLGRGVKRRFTFLRYNAVFRQSGQPAGMTGWRAFLVSFMGDLDDWRQLDHAGAVMVVLDEAERPVALMMQPHSFHRTYVFGIDAALPADGRPQIDVAIRSNELYRHVDGRVEYRAVRFMAPEGMRYLLGGGRRPTMSADDITDSVGEAEYALQFLPPSDAFYAFKGHLGQRRSMSGREGPPGADYNTLPELKPLAMQLLAGYWHRDDAGDLKRFEESYGKSGNPRDFARAQIPQFAAALEAARAKTKR
jgi:hypothetical protein